MYDHGMLPPILALITWTFVLWVWMYATRIPAIRRANIDVEALARTGGSLELPPKVSRVADNYNHLHEQPTLFYALALAAHLAGTADAVSIGLAWGYVLVRVVHSLIQATVNVIMLRFLVFSVGSVVLLVLLLRTVLLL
jgi:hypothetical protein